MPSEYETAVYTSKEMKSARRKGQLVGWAQGALTTATLLFLLKFIGWIPALLAVALVAVLGFMGLRKLAGRKSDG